MSNVTAIRNQATDVFAGIPAQDIIDKALELLAEQHKPGSDPLRCPENTQRYLRLKLAHLQHEVFGCLFLDNRHRVIELRELFTGTIDGASIYPREVVKAALSANARAVIFYHNHPSGVCEPSQADITLTKRLKEALGLVDISVLDHLIVSGEETGVSLAIRKLI